MSNRRIRGVEENESVDRKHLLRDVRPLGQKIADFFRNTSYVNAMFILLGVGVFIFPALYLFALLSLILVLLFHAKVNTKQRLPFRVPKSADMTDYGDPIPGRKKYAKSGGIFFLGNEMKENKELWLKDKDLLTHMLIFGTTGSGKTESLVSLACNSVAMGSGLFYIDPKAAPKLAFQIYVLARICGRDDDFRVLNYGTGGKGGNKNTPKRLSNTQNPFAFGSAENLSQLLISLIPSSEGGNAIFSQNAQVLITSLMYALVELRDRGEMLLSIDKVREYTTLNKFHELASQEKYSLSEGTLNAIKSFLTSVGWQEGKPLDKQPRSLPEQFGYARMYFGLSLQSFADSYGHIYQTTMGEIDMYDVIMHRRIMVTMLPSLEKAPQELQNLGKISLSAVRNAISVGLGDKIEGTAEDVLEALPTDAPTPFLTIVDEYAAIPTEGFAEILTQGRGLGVAAIVASQDYDGITKADEKGAGQIVANTKIKLCMTLEDPKSTWELFNALAGESTIMQTQGFSKNDEQLFQFSYHDQLSASLDKVSRIHIQDLQEQIEGEFHAFFKGDVLRGSVFYANPPLDSKLQLRINQMLEVEAPRKDYIDMKYGNVGDLLEVMESLIKGEQTSEVDEKGVFVQIGNIFKNVKSRSSKPIVAFLYWKWQKNESFEIRGQRASAEEAEIVQEQTQLDESTNPYEPSPYQGEEPEEGGEAKNEQVESSSQDKLWTKDEMSNLQTNIELLDQKWGTKNFCGEEAIEDIAKVEGEFDSVSNAEEKANAVCDKIKKDIQYPPEPEPKKDTAEVKKQLNNLIKSGFEV